MPLTLTGTTRAKRYSKGTYVYILLAIIIAGLIGYYGYDKVNLYSEMKAWISENEGQKSEIRTAIQEEQKAYQEDKTVMTSKMQKKIAILDDIFPPEESLTVLTRAFDKFFIENDFANNPLNLPSLSFGAVQTNEEWDYNILPVTLTASGSRINFLKFLAYIEDSGLMDSKNRLMAIERLDIDFQISEEAAEGEAIRRKPQEIVSFTANINAYFQKQGVE